MTMLSFKITKIENGWIVDAFGIDKKIRDEVATQFYQVTFDDAVNFVKLLKLNIENEKGEDL